MQFVVIGQNTVWRRFGGFQGAFVLETVCCFCGLCLTPVQVISFSSVQCSPSSSTKTAKTITTTPTPVPIPIPTNNQQPITNNSLITHECPFSLCVSYGRDGGQRAACECCSATERAIDRVLLQGAAVDRHGFGNCTPPQRWTPGAREWEEFSRRTTRHGDRPLLLSLSRSPNCRSRKISAGHSHTVSTRVWPQERSRSSGPLSMYLCSRLWNSWSALWSHSMLPCCRWLKDEVVLHSQRAMLYRGRDSEWEAEGTGDAKLLMHKKKKRYVACCVKRQWVGRSLAMSTP